MSEIVFFSNNDNKIKEIKKIFSNVNIKISSSKEYNLFKQPVESGKSFAENAKIKSVFGFKKLKLPCFADDSGICIEALDWGPGILSSRFMGNFKSKKECLEYIISKVSESKKRRAFFKTSICLTLRNSQYIIFEGKVNGYISNKILGNNGFGYDPIFIPENNNKTFSQMNKKEKNTLSHRYVAVNKFINFLSN